MKSTAKNAAASQLPTGSALMLILAGGCSISLLTFGLRGTFGLFTNPVSLAHDWPRDTFAFAMAIQNLCWGIGQPFAGALVDRFGAMRVLMAGGIFYAAGLLWMSVASSPGELHVSAGALVGFGMAGASFTTVLSVFGKIVPPERRSWALGLGTAAGSLGQFLVVPLGQLFIAAHGWEIALLWLAGLAALVPLLATAFSGTNPAGSAQAEPAPNVPATLRAALAHRSYLLLLAGFFVCGFQLAFITIHLPPYLHDEGLAPEWSALAVGVIGLFNIAGAYLSGDWGARHSKTMLLSAIYLGRAVVTALFLVLPLTPTSTLLFSAAMGLLWLSTVPPTSGLVATMFGIRSMGTLFGLVFFSHQLGSFVGVWLAGALYERSGSYDVVWWLSVALAVLSALVHLPIAERPAPGFTSATAT